MAKVITIEFSDAEFTALQEAYSLDDASATEAYVKTKFINVVKSAVRSHDEKAAKEGMKYTSFDPK